MYAFKVNYQDPDTGGSRPRGQLLNMGLFVVSVPRLILACRLLGHKPVIDGTEPYQPVGAAYRGSAHRWVVCDRCGVRAHPQGTLNPDNHPNLGARYHGPWDDSPPADEPTRKRMPIEPPPVYSRPGRIERRPTGAFGAQLIVGRGHFGAVGWEVKVGNSASEHTLAAHVNLGALGALYVHTERFGTWLQRRLNPVGYHSRLIGFEISTRAISWNLWALRDGGDSRIRDRDPRWRRGEIDVRILDKMLGPKRYSYTDIPGADVARLVRMPEGDYLVRLRLRRVVHGRRHGRKTMGWSVNWDCLGRGIPTKGPERGRVYGSGVNVSDEAVKAGTWPAEAVAAIIVDATADRTSHRWEPTGPVPVFEAKAPA